MSEAAMRILEYLNQRANRAFEPVKANLAFIQERLREYTEEKLIRMIDNQIKEWKNTEWERYLRPATLFNKTKCAQYIGQIPKEKVKTETNGDEAMPEDLISQDEALGFIREITGKVKKVKDA